MKLNVKNAMDFLHSKGVKLPMGYLLLHDHEKLTEKDLNVKGSLDLRYTKITSLPEGLKVEGYLDLYNTKITSLPEGLKVEGYLDLDGTPIKKLPEGLTIRGNLWIRDTLVEELPDKLKVQGFIFVDKDKLNYFKERYPKLSTKIKAWDTQVI